MKEKLKYLFTRKYILFSYTFLMVCVVVLGLGVFMFKYSLFAVTMARSTPFASYIANTINSPSFAKSYFAKTDNRHMSTEGVLTHKYVANGNYYFVLDNSAIYNVKKQEYLSTLVGTEVTKYLMDDK